MILPKRLGEKEFVTFLVFHKEKKFTYECGPFHVHSLDNVVSMIPLSFVQPYRSAQLSVTQCLRLGRAASDHTGGLRMTNCRHFLRFLQEFAR